MNKENLIKAIDDRFSGQIATVETLRPCKVYKNVVDVVEKKSTFQVRLGLEYGNQACVKEAWSTGEREKIGLPNGWVVKNRVCVVTSTGKELLRGSPVRNNPHSVRKVVFFLNGKEVSKDSIFHLLTSEEKKESNGDWIYITPENLQSINGDESFRITE